MTLKWIFQRTPTAKIRCSMSSLVQPSVRDACGPLVICQENRGHEPVLSQSKVFMLGVKDIIFLVAERKLAWRVIDRSKTLIQWLVHRQPSVEPWRPFNIPLSGNKTFCCLSFYSKIQGRRLEVWNRLSKKPSFGLRMRAF